MRQGVLFFFVMMTVCGRCCSGSAEERLCYKEQHASSRTPRSYLVSQRLSLSENLKEENNCVY